MSISPFEDDRDYDQQPVPGSMRIGDRPLSEFAPHAWSFDDQRAALLRGWGVMNLQDVGPSIVRSEFVDVFDSDEDAAAHVEAHREDSPLCAKAAAYVELAGAEWRYENERLAA